MKQNVYSVSQINNYLKNMISQDFLCSSVFIQGELSNVKYHGSGHIYFTLKDAGAAISCVMYASSRRGLSFRMEEGQKVIAGGMIDVYVQGGKYQLSAKQIALVGGGPLYEEFLRLKGELEEMGMFAAEYKQPIPGYVNRLGVVTAKEGAAIRDIINVSKRRNPYVEIVLFPAYVQGEKAVESIVSGIRALEKENVDVMIVGRGGGSIEELWAFNSVEVAQAVFDCRTPVISAVGHETDTTIIDYVADLRAPTPSAAAELAVCDIFQTIDRIEECQRLLGQLMCGKIRMARLETDKRALRLKGLSPVSVVSEKRMRTLALEETLERTVKQKILQARNRLGLNAAKLEALSPLQKLAAGYAYVTDEKEKPVLDGRRLSEGDDLTIWFQHAKARARVSGIEEIRYGD